MNYIFVMLIATASGNVVEAHSFNSLVECERAASKLKVNAACIQKEKIDVETQMRKMIAIMKAMQTEMEKQ
jgi:hypothetical protein